MTRTEARWRCRRSILELDILMSSFFDACYDELDQDMQILFCKYLELEDKALMEILFYAPKSCVLLAQIRQFDLLTT